MKGQIRSVKSDKGFGFIKDDESKEYFFHRSDFTGHWNDLLYDVNQQGMRIPVEYEIEETDKGLRARNVRRTDWPNQS